MTIINAAWIDPDSKSYFTHNSKYYTDKDRIERSFPGVFSGIGFKSIDAALIGAGSREGKVYFFSGELYTRFDFINGKCDSGYPLVTKDIWGIPFANIDAAWSHPKIKNKYYMSRGSEYIRLTVDKGGFDRGYPKPISRYWKGVEFAYIDAVIQGTGNRSGKLYFFSGDQYVRYDMEMDRVDSGYPKLIIPIWGVPNSWKTKNTQDNNRSLLAINNNFQTGYDPVVENISETNNGNEICIKRSININAGTRDFKEFSDAPDWLLPGVIIKASSFLDASYVEVSRPRHSIDIYAKDYAGQNVITNRKVENPHKSFEIQKEVAFFRSQKNVDIAANIKFSYKEIHSIEDLEFSIKGQYSNSISGISAKLGVNYGTKKENHYYMIDYTQGMFSLLARITGNESAIFKDQKPIQHEDIYIASVTYGRRAIIIVKTKLNLTEFGLDIEASLKGLVNNGQLNIGVRTASREEEFELTGILYGGTISSGIDSFETIIKDKNVNIFNWLRDHPGDPSYALPISYKLKNLKGEDVGLKSIFDQTVRTCVPIAKNIRFRVTLTGIKSVQARDSDNLADFGLQQWVIYKVNNKNTKKYIKSIDKDIFIYKKFIDKVSREPAWADRNIISMGDVDHQIHVKEGTTKRIDNSIVFDITPKEASDKRASFKIYTWLKEYTAGDDKIIANGRHINVDIYKVLAALLAPGSIEDGAIGNDNSRASMRFWKSGNGLEGSIEFGDNNKETYVRIKLLFQLID